MLRDALNEALEHGRTRLPTAIGVTALATSDSEEYALEVLHLDADYPGREWDRAAVPYSDPGAKEQRPEAIHPADRHPRSGLEI